MAEHRIAKGKSRRPSKGMTAAATVYAAIRDAMTLEALRRAENEILEANLSPEMTEAMIKHAVKRRETLSKKD